MVRRLKLKQPLKQLGILLCVTTIGLWATAALLHAQGNQLLHRSLTIGNSQGGKTTNYKFSFQPIGLDTMETILLQVCSNSPFPGTPCTAPVGFDASHANLINQSGDAGFSISGASNANQIILQRSPLVSNAQQDTYEFSNVVNPSNRGSYYVRVQTFGDSGVTGDPTNYGGIAFAINDGIGVTATVPPYLLFCVGVTVIGYDCHNVIGSQIDFGEFGSGSTSLGDTQMVAATNAIDGYTIHVQGTTLTSGNNVITAMTAADVSRAGVSQFGMNLRANNAPRGGLDPTGSGSGTPSSGYNQINFYRFSSGDLVASSPSVEAGRKYTSNYVVNVTKGQSPGVYVSTLTYIALGSF